MGPIIVFSRCFHPGQLGSRTGSVIIHKNQFCGLGATDATQQHDDQVSFQKCLKSL